MEKTPAPLTCLLSCSAQKDQDIYARLRVALGKKSGNITLVSLDPDATKPSMDQKLKGRECALLLGWPGAEAFCPGCLSDSEHTYAQTLKGVGSARTHWESHRHICIPTDHFLPGTQKPVWTLFQSVHRVRCRGQGDAITWDFAPALHRHSQLCALGPGTWISEGAILSCYKTVPGLGCTLKSLGELLKVQMPGPQPDQ